ncbi:hypothetical protein, partial [uncultured Akkermansia sp.]|uniref:hypothetical protein n=1 Tax=uncultured Akkermansia sp. TaxID=512294 RepID=UPI0026274368
TPCLIALPFPSLKHVPENGRPFFCRAIRQKRDIPSFPALGTFLCPAPGKHPAPELFPACKRMGKTGKNHHILLTSIFIDVSIGLIAKWRTLSQNYC